MSMRDVKEKYTRVHLLSAFMRAKDAVCGALGFGATRVPGLSPGLRVGQHAPGFDNGSCTIQRVPRSAQGKGDFSASRPEGLGACSGAAVRELSAAL